MPSDKSIAHRALLFASLCNGKSCIRAWAGGDDNASTRAALASMGVAFDESGTARDRQIVVTGVGLFGLRKPDHDLDCGNSGTTMRLLTGILAAQDFDATLVGDASLSRRPMMRIAGPLNARGAKITGKPHPTKQNEITAPLRVEGLAEGSYLGAIEYELPVASAQVKSALLLSGLYAHGTTTLREPMLSRDHTERMLAALGVPLKTLSTMVELDPAGWNGTMPPFDMAIPGDISAATFLLGAALLVPGSNITARNVGINPTRTGILDALRMMNAPFAIEPIGDANGEPVGNLTMTNAGDVSVTGASVANEVVTRAIDEIPALCAIASCAHGTTTIRDAQELRVKESDRIDATLGMLRAFGVDCEPIDDDGMIVSGKAGASLKPATIDSRGDHRIAMSAAIMALRASAPSKITNADCIATSFPKFVSTLRALGATIDLI